MTREPVNRKKALVADYAGASFSHLEPPKISEDRPSRH